MSRPRARRSRFAPISTPPKSTRRAASSRWWRSMRTATARTDEAVPRAAAQCRAHVRRAGRPAGRRLAQPPHAVRSAARPARDRGRRRPCRTEARDDRRQWRQGRAGADVPPRQLRDRRRVRHHQCERHAAIAVRVLPAHPRHQAAGGAELGRAVGVRRPGRLHRTGQVQEGRIRRNRQARRRSDAQAAVPQDRRQRLGRDGRALFRRRVAAVRRAEDAARVLHEEARQRAVRGRCHRAGRHDRARRHRRSARAAVRRAAGPGHRSPRRRRASTSSSTTASSPSSRRRSSGCSSGCTGSSATGAGRSSS